VNKSPNIIHIFTTKQAKLLSLNGSEPYDPKEPNQLFLSDYICWASIKQKISESRQNLRQRMVTPQNVGRPISAEEFQQQTEALKEVTT